MDIKMKCMYKEGQTECTASGTFTCNDCQILVLYCETHAGIHFMKTAHKNFEALGLKHFKKQIKTSISNIVKYTSDAITEIRRTSLSIIINLKQVIKNAKNIDELTQKLHDAEKVSLFIQQVRNIDKKMNEVLQESTEKLNIRKEELNSQIENIFSINGTI